MNYFNNVVNRFSLGLPSFIEALLLLLVAFIVAYLVKKLIMNIGKRTKLSRHMGKAGMTEKPEDSLEFFGNLGFLIVFVLFLPGVFARLGLESISAPITGMLTGLLNFIPNLLGSILILVIGVFIARLVKQLAIGLFERLNVDRFQEKMRSRSGEPVGEEVSLSNILGNIVYILILIPVIIAALQVLNISIISEPALNMLNAIFVMIPNIIAGIILIMLGIFIAKLVADLIYNLLAGMGLNSKVNQMIDDPRASNINLERIISEAIRYIIILILTVEAFNVMNLGILENIGSAILLYLPLVLSAGLILLGGYVLGMLARSAIHKNFPDARLLGNIVQYVIVGLAAFMALSELGIADYFINIAFIAIVAAAAVAFAISFGIGGRDFARNMLKKAETKLDDAGQAIREKKPEMERNMDKNRDSSYRPVDDMSFDTSGDPTRRPPGTTYPGSTTDPTLNPMDAHGSGPTEPFER
jgi:hypothetical protein